MIRFEKLNLPTTHSYKHTPTDRGFMRAPKHSNTHSKWNTMHRTSQISAHLCARRNCCARGHPLNDHHLFGIINKLIHFDSPPKPIRLTVHTLCACICITAIRYCAEKYVLCESTYIQTLFRSTSDRKADALKFPLFGFRGYISIVFGAKYEI